MNALRVVAATLFAAVTLTVTGCGSGPDGINVITRTQSDTLDNLKNPGLTALKEAGYTTVGIGASRDGRHLVLLRHCGKTIKSLTDCLHNLNLGTETPDVYLGIKSTDQLNLTGAFDLLYMAPVGHHPDNGLKCNLDPANTKFSAETIASFQPLGQQSHKLNYKRFEGGNPTQTLQIGENWWKCRTTFGQIQ